MRPALTLSSLTHLLMIGVDLWTATHHYQILLAANSNNTSICCTRLSRTPLFNRVVIMAPHSQCRLRPYDRQPFSVSETRQLRERNGEAQLLEVQLLEAKTRTIHCLVC